MSCNHTLGTPVKMNGVVDGDFAKPVEMYREREKWGNKIEFILSCIAFSVGLGNVWRFPYLCYKNGGGAFLIPYMVCLVTGGIPIFFMEIALGQYTSQGGISVWNSICPLFKGIGYGTTVIVFLLNLYYIIILSWALVFLYYSFTSELPWASCGHEWNTENCWSFSKANKTSVAASLSANASSIIEEARTLVNNLTTSVNLVPTLPAVMAVSTKKVDASVEFWENKVLQISSGIDEPGRVVWELALSLLIAWIMCYFCIWKGVKSTGKAVYFTAIFPYLMLTVLLIRGVTLPGAWKGIVFYLRPDFSRLTDGQVWIDAGTQIFFSYAIALGCMTALGSYNDFHNNFYHQCIFIACCNSGTSLYAGFAIFSVLGFMAYEQGVPVQDVAESGPGLAFIAYPKAVAQMPLAPMWAVLFFIMIVLLGLGSQFVAIEGFITSVVDTVPEILRKGYRREYFIGVTCFVSYLIGLSMVTQGGMYVLQLFDYYAASGMTLLWFCFFESVTIAWIYGVDRFYDNITEMLKFRINPWLGLCWKYFTPMITMSIFLFSLITFKPLRYNQTYVYPTWSIVIGWCLALVSMVCIPIYFFYKLFTTEGTLPQRWKALITPNLPMRVSTSEPVEMSSPVKEKPQANGGKPICNGV